MTDAPLGRASADWLNAPAPRSARPTRDPACLSCAAPVERVVQGRIGRTATALGVSQARPMAWAWGPHGGSDLAVSAPSGNTSAASSRPGPPWGYTNNGQCSQGAAHIVGEVACALATSDFAEAEEAARTAYWLLAGYEVLVRCSCSYVGAITTQVEPCVFYTQCNYSCQCDESLIGTPEGFPVG